MKLIQTIKVGLIEMNHVKVQGSSSKGLWCYVCALCVFCLFVEISSPFTIPASRLPCYVFCICMLIYTNKYQKYKSVYLSDQLHPCPPYSCHNLRDVPVVPYTQLTITKRHANSPPIGVLSGSKASGKPLSTKTEDCVVSCVFHSSDSLPRFAYPNGFERWREINNTWSLFLGV